jgi:hypothetical protein
VSAPRDPATETAKRDLARIAREGETLGGTAMDTASRGLSQSDGEDHIDRLGKKIGRGIAFALLPVMMWYFGSTAGWW